MIEMVAAAKRPKFEIQHIDGKKIVYVSWKYFRENMAGVFALLWLEQLEIVVLRHNKPAAKLVRPSTCLVVVPERSDNEESVIEADLYKNLLSIGIACRRQVKLVCGRADIVIYDSENSPKTLVEVKVSIRSAASAKSARRQAGLYARELGASSAFVVATDIDCRFVGVVDGIQICTVEEFLRGYRKS